MKKNDEYEQEYITFMSEMNKNDFCELVPAYDVNKPIWYIPHNGVYHRVKKKIRVVFGCSTIFKRKSINDCLLTGTDFINSLLGILLLFRKEQVAFQCDITKIFLQFRVQPHQRELLRFLWWDEGDKTRLPSHFRMKSHLLGAFSSMGCANVGLKGIADDYKHMYGKDAADIIRVCFYVDDNLCSVSSKKHAADLIKRSIAMC